MFSIRGINQVGRPDTAPCLESYERTKKAGGDATYLSLPKLPSSPVFDRIPQRNIWCKDHIVMWDDNSDQIASVLMGWIDRRVRKVR
jgi:hypothetical protein